MRLYSIVVPVYNRPEEIKELLASLTLQTYSNFELVVVEDGSDLTCESVVESFKKSLNIQYFFKPNTGQGFSRNFAYERCKGDYFIVFDSDCIVPPNYLEKVEERLNAQWVDAYGGPDRAHSSFTNVQKAISYSMTSVFTTGGIRGNKKHVGTFHPRSFNMGISKEVFEKTKGYVITRMGEDIEFSIRIIRSGFSTGLIEDAFVYHKRRTSIGQFYRQLKFFGRARINISRFYSSELKLVHLFPFLFLMACVFWVASALVVPTLFQIGLPLVALYVLLIFMDATKKNKSVKVGVLSIVTSFTQLFAYGVGFLQEGLKKLAGDKDPLKERK